MEGIMKYQFWARVLFNPVWDDSNDDPDKDPDKDPNKDLDKDKDPNKDKTFTQDDVNKIVQDRLAKEKKTQQKRITDLENQLNSSGSLSVEERTQLETRIEELNNSLLSKDELAQKEKEKLAKKHQSELEEAVKEREDWKNRFTLSTIRNEITSASAEAEAFSPSQIVTLLSPDTRLVEELDEEGKPNGNLVPKVKFQDTDKKGKQVTLELTVKETLNRMKELPERFGNLFKSNVASGLGSNNQGGTKNNAPDLSNPAEYRKWRQQQKKEGKL